MKEEQTYNYCDCCGKPVNSADHDCYAFCKECASRLLSKIYGVSESAKSNQTLFLDTQQVEIKSTAG